MFYLRHFQVIMLEMKQWKIPELETSKFHGERTVFQGFNDSFITAVHSSKLLSNIHTQYKFEFKVAALFGPYFLLVARYFLLVAPYFLFVAGYFFVHRILWMCNTNWERTQ